MNTTVPGFLISILVCFFSACDVNLEQETPPIAEVPSAWVTELVVANNLQQVIFESAILSQKVSYHLYLPPAYYKELNRSFPVLYWLHGSGGGVAGIPPIVSFYHQAMVSQWIAPMIIVFPYSFDNGMWSNSKDGKYPIENVFIQELIPQVDEQFRTQANKEGRILEGFSMGGHGAARLGFKYPELFAAASFFGAGPVHLDFLDRGLVPPAQRRQIFADVYGNDQDYYEAQHPKTWASIHRDRIREELPFRLVIGEGDGLYALNVAFRDYLIELGHVFDFQEIEGVGHVTIPLFRGLGGAHWDFYRRFFK